MPNKRERDLKNNVSSARQSGSTIYYSLARTVQSCRQDFRTQLYGKTSTYYVSPGWLQLVAWNLCFRLGILAVRRWRDVARLFHQAYS